MKRNLRSLFTILTLLAIGAATVSGQAVTGSIVGSVTDASGAAIAGAKVIIAETSTGIARTATTNSEGGYVMPYLQPGIYRIEVEKTGFKKSTVNDVRLATGQSVRVNLTLESGKLPRSLKSPLRRRCCKRKAPISANRSRLRKSPNCRSTVAISNR